MKFIAGLVLSLFLPGSVLAAATATAALPQSQTALPQVLSSLAEPEDSLTRLPPDGPPLTAPALPPPAAEAPAAPKQVTVGDTVLTLPPLDGFHELYGKNKTFDGMVDQFVTPGNRMLAVYVSDPDIAAMNVDPQAGLKKYILVQARNDDFRIKSAADFDAVRAEIAREVGDGSLKDSKDVSEEVSKAAGYMHDQFGKDMQIKVGETKFLGRFVDSREALSYLLATNYGVTTPEGAKSFPIVAAMSVLTVRERPLFIFVYSNYATGADIDFATQNTKKFLDRVFVANGGAPGQAAAGSSTEAGGGEAGSKPSAADIAKEPAVETKDESPADFFQWATWGAIIVALIAGAALAGPKIFKKLGEKDENL